MAILPILDKSETKHILKQLSIKNHSTKELNEAIVGKMRKCSTATLYRRLKELHIGSIINLTNGIYSLSELGKKLVREIQQQEDMLKRKKLGIDYRQKSYLRTFGTKPYSQHEYQQQFQKSPTEISDQFKQLLKLNLIELIDNPIDQKKKRGRPTKRFRLTQEGKELLKMLGKVDELFQGEKENEN